MSPSSDLEECRRVLYNLYKRLNKCINKLHQELAGRESSVGLALGYAVVGFNLPAIPSMTLGGHSASPYEGVKLGPALAWAIRVNSKDPLCARKSRAQAKVHSAWL